MTSPRRPTEDQKLRGNDDYQALGEKRKACEKIPQSICPVVREVKLQSRRRMGYSDQRSPWKTGLRFYCVDRSSFVLAAAALRAINSYPLLLASLCSRSSRVRAAADLPDVASSSSSMKRNSNS